ncbi:F0F1 ATP synthase subunit epsilon [Pelagibacterium xiamenense]|uniref:F0F1 ATP synthase subunit epsilon n=1 Tax=Pelagibacterium xiamenense TaxID=2901140 RepID=UPI001E3801E6|nr:F0F1 ATP synthase subunit epsilon [Pelagibacterium xiamenense]MCD7058266.1 F0F1 ATP synthase subunit epsilon [Pelagibacterium xiamenense]
MADGVKIEIVSPEYLVLSAEVRSVVVPGAEGYLTVMGEHAPLMTTLKPGFVTVTNTDGAATSYFVGGGFADISQAGLTILAEDAKPASEFGRTEIEAKIAEAQEALSAAEDIDAKSAAQNRLDTWKNLLVESAGLGRAAH